MNNRFPAFIIKNNTFTAVWKQAGDLQNELSALLIGSFMSRKRTGRKRSLPIGTASPHLFHTLQKISGHVKVCALCSEKKKKLHQEGVNRQNINVSSVIFHYVMWVFFGIPPAA
jgi:hypothetical protein